VECIWIEVFLSKNKSILFGVFYRPPSADSLYMKSIEDSIGLARETRINDIFITGDFNINALVEPSARTINELCLQYDLTQLIYEPTHYTEQSSSIIDLIFVSNENTVLLSGIGEPFFRSIYSVSLPSFRYIEIYKTEMQNLFSTYLALRHWGLFKITTINDRHSLGSTKIRKY